MPQRTVGPNATAATLELSFAAILRNHIGNLTTITSPEDQVRDILEYDPAVTGTPALAPLIVMVAPEVQPGMRIDTAKVLEPDIVMVEVSEMGNVVDWATVTLRADQLSTEGVKRLT